MRNEHHCRHTNIRTALNSDTRLSQASGAVALLGLLIVSEIKQFP